MKNALLIGLTLLGMTMNIALAKDDDDNEIIQEGTITTITESVVTVAAVDFLLTGGTEYENANDQHVSHSYFNVGDYVKVKGYLASGILVAKEIELEVHNGSGDDSSGKDKNKSNKKSDDSRIRLRDKLVIESGVTSGVSGWIRFQERTKSGRITTKFAAKVEVPVPSDLPLVEDEIDAEDLLVELVLKRFDGTQYSQCEFEFDELEEDDDRPLTAEYKIDLRLINKNGDLTRRMKKGSCVSTGETEPSVPQVEAGDTVEVYADDDLIMTGAL